MSSMRKNFIQNVIQNPQYTADKYKIIDNNKILKKHLTAFKELWIGDKTISYPTDDPNDPNWLLMHNDKHIFSMTISRGLVVELGSEESSMRDQLTIYPDYWNNKNQNDYTRYFFGHSWNYPEINPFSVYEYDENGKLKYIV